MADQVTTSLAEAKVLVMEGKAGFSPQIEVRDIDGGHQIRITTKISTTQYETQVFNVLDGTDGAPGQKGDPGVPGTPGADGFSPTVEVQDIVRSLPGGGTEVIGHKVIITDANGPHIFNVMDGEDGEGGGGGAAEAVLYIAQSLTAAQKAQARENIGAGTYSKPSGGIPASDLTHAAQTSLGKADTALQPSGLSTAVSNLDVYVYALSVSGTSVSLATSFTDFYNKYSNGLRPLIYLPYGGGVSDPIAMEMRLIYVDALAISITLRGEHDGNRYEVTLSASSYTATPMTGTLVTTPLQELPAVSSTDNGSILGVVNGAWAKNPMATQADMSDWAQGKTVDAAVLKADFTSAIQRLGGVETSVDDLQTAVSQKADSADIPTKTSDLTNDSGFQTAAQVQSAMDEVTNMMPFVVKEIAPTEEIIIDDGADNAPVRDMILNIGVQQTGEGTPSSSNVRPITGFTNASAFRSGKNLLHISGREVAPSGNILNTTPRDFSKPFLYVGITVNNYYNKNNAVYSVDGETLTVMSKSGGYGVGLNVDVEPDTDYVLSMGGGLTTSYAGFGLFDASGSFLSFQYEGALSFRTPSNCKYVMVVLRPKDANVEVQYTNVQLERGTTATAYEAPETVFSYDFNDPIYGGTIDPVTGVLTVTHANIASYNGEAINEPWYSSVNAYASGSTPSAGAQVVYPLSNPVTYQLEKTAVKTKYGANTIWGNTGTISTRYCADMKMYIDHAIEVAMES